MKCILQPVNAKYGRCEACCRLARHASGDDDRECPGVPPPPGLGDMLKAGLDAVGFTQDRVSAVTGDCNCPARQEALNAIGRAIGIGLPPDSPEPPPV
jgi:hypothetical protein